MLTRLTDAKSMSMIGMHKFKQKVQLRTNRGMSIILLVIVLATVQLAIDFFVFNLVRILMVERQLNGICEAASLAGTSILAKLDVANDDSNHKRLAAAQKAACRCAENMVLRGHILGNIIDKAIDAGELPDLGKNLKQGCCQYIVTVASPDNNYSPVNFGDPSGRTISCYIVYGYKPIFLDFLGSVCYAVTGNCISGLPQIDSVLVLDLSASMDDQTAVTFVRREWIRSPLGAGSFPTGDVDPGKMNSSGCGIVQYVSLNCPMIPHTLANYLGWQNNDNAGGAADDSEVLDGSLVNVLPPQNLDKAASEPHGAITHPMYFDAYLRSHYSHYDSKLRYLPWEATQAPYLRAHDYGSPPGNCDLSVGLGGNGDALTDMAGNAVTFNHGTSNASPQINAFGDLAWQYDNDQYFGYQPAAPGALHGLAENDPVPSADQQTFTDLVVNIANPSLSSSGYTANNSQYEQPLNGPDNFIGFSYTFPADEPDFLLRNQTFNFPNIGVVVEAARGNLENTAILSSGLKNAQAALIDRPVSVNGNIFDMRSIGTKDGYQRAYQRLAMLFTQPLASVLAAADQAYLQKLHKFADCRFGLVAFSSAGSLSNNAIYMRTIGTLNDQSANIPSGRSFYLFTAPYGNRIYSNATYDGGQPTIDGLNDNPIPDGSGFGFRIPRVPLNANAENYLQCASQNILGQPGTSDQTTNTDLNAAGSSNSIYNCRAQSITDSGEALQTAYNMFHSDTYNLDNSRNCRQAASKLIVFFTDGEPTGGITAEQAQTMLAVAGQGHGSRYSSTCEANGIAIVTVSLNLCKGKTYDRRKEHQLILLDDQQPDSGQPGGIAWRAGHGGRYYACDSLDKLKPAFSEITRRYSQSQR